MRKIQTLVAALALAVGVFAFGGSAAAAPGPNGHNDFGLCKAYNAGSDKGKEKKHAAGPFVALEQAADEAGDGDGTATQDEIDAFCSEATPGGK